MADGDTPRLTATFVPTHHLQLRHGFGGCTGYAVQRNFQPPEILLGPTQVLTVHLRYVIGYPDYHIPNRFKTGQPRCRRIPRQHLGLRCRTWSGVTSIPLAYTLGAGLSVISVCWYRGTYTTRPFPSMSTTISRESDPSDSILETVPPVFCRTGTSSTNRLAAAIGLEGAVASPCNMASLALFKSISSASEFPKKGASSRLDQHVRRAMGDSHTISTGLGTVLG